MFQIRRILARNLPYSFLLAKAVRVVSIFRGEMPPTGAILFLFIGQVLAWQRSFHMNNIGYRFYPFLREFHRSA